MRKLTPRELERVAGGMLPLRTPDECLPGYNACHGRAATSGDEANCQIAYTACLNGY
jgi:hypothetical protein